MSTAQRNEITRAIWGLSRKERQQQLSGKAVYLAVRAGVRYWEDASVNGQEDTDGQIPCRVGDSWCPTIRLSDGHVMDWPAGTVADIHYKVCDDGEYFLADQDRQPFAQRRGHYVPSLLSIGDNGYGDYIILKIGADGKIEDWQPPVLDLADWRDPASDDEDE